MVERNLFSDIAFHIHRLSYEEDKILVIPPSYFIPNPYRPYLVLVRKKQFLITAYWVCLEKFIKIRMQEPCFILNLENPDENSSYIIL
ncbi:MAG: hypothetical protein NZ551_01055, partial [Microscillaceae bacterium]|nr:hypothetical protein [Microscillaceae bacterium]MDW8459777.1 hypothetical protein [Cytophagales bacterium]